MSPLDPARRFAKEVGSIFENRRHFRPHPPSTGLVVEVGGGHSPYPRADLVIEKYIADDFERAEKVSFSRPIVVGDGQAIPLADKCASYVIASHVLEHATDPVLFASELSRVAGAGYVEVPSRESELTYGWPFHPWLIDLEGETLIFEPRKDAAAPVGQKHHDLFNRSILQQLSFASHRKMWHHAVEWNDSLKVRAPEASIAPASAQFDLNATVAVLESATTLPLTADAARALACPACRGSLNRQGAETLSCASCGASYPVINRVPILLVDATT